MPAGMTLSGDRGNLVVKEELRSHGKSVGDDASYQKKVG
jgi:hypothetical protein